MTEENQPDDNPNNTDGGNGDGSALGYLQGVCVAALWVFILLLIVAIAWPGLTERTKFFTNNFFNLVIAFAVIAQVIVNRKQWVAMRESIRIGERSSIYAQRAYVVAKIRDTGKHDEELMFRLRIVNNGNTPANDVVVCLASGMRDKPPHEETPDGMVVYDNGFSQTERLGLVSATGSYHVVNTPRVQFPLPHVHPSEYKSWETGALRFYCWGRISYEDIFNEKRHTDFCFVLSREHPDGYPCKHGNEAF